MAASGESTCTPSRRSGVHSNRTCCEVQVADGFCFLPPGPALKRRWECLPAGGLNPRRGGAGVGPPRGGAYASSLASSVSAFGRPGWVSSTMIVTRERF
jgi:hypothetical protein